MERSEQTAGHWQEVQLDRTATCLLRRLILFMCSPLLNAAVSMTINEWKRK
jgi:hypothetical protein